MAKILIVEDEEAIRIGLIDVLELEGYEIREAADGAIAMAIADEWTPDLVVLDLMLPRKNGLEVCRYLRKRYPAIFILMLTAKSEEIDKISGLEMGADDYMTKPFSVMELLARIKSMLRRLHRQQAAAPAELAFGSIRINFKKYECTKRGKPLELSAKEFQILHYLAQRRGEVVRREELLQSIWGYALDNMPTTRTVDNQIAKLRAKIETDLTRPAYILSVRGVGYKFESEGDGT